MDDVEIKQAVADTLLDLRLSLKEKHKFSEREATAVVGYALVRSACEMIARGLGFKIDSDKAETIYAAATAAIHDGLY